MALNEKGRRIRWTENGRRQSQTFPHGTPRKVIDEFKKDVKLGKIILSERRECPTLEGYAEHFLKVYPTIAPGGRQESTIRKDVSTFECHLLPVFGSWKLSDIKPRHILEFQSMLMQAGPEDEGGLAPQTVRNVVSMLSVVMKLAVIEEWVEYNPCKSVPRPSRTFSEPAFWSFDEKDRFLLEAQTHDWELFQIAAFACDTGARIGELEGLLGDSLNLREGYVELRRTFCTKTREVKDRIKNGVARRVYLSPEIVRLMGSKRGVGLRDRVFPLNFNLLGIDRLTPMCERAKVRRITPHGWRHTFASHLLMLGKPPKDVQTALGHKKISTTLDTYGHLLEDYKRGITDGLNHGMKWTRSADAKVVSLAEAGGRTWL